MHRSAQRDTFAMLTHRRGGGEGGAAFIDNRTDSWGAIVTKELGLLAGKTRPLIAFSSFSNLFQFHLQPAWTAGPQWGAIVTKEPELLLAVEPKTACSKVSVRFSLGQIYTGCFFQLVPP